MKGDVDWDVINEHLEVYGEPHQISLTPQTHIFHFGSTRDNWDDPDPGVIFVNRNGHFFRLLQSRDSADWIYANTWMSVDSCEDWHLARGIDDICSSRLIDKTSTGDREGRDSLSYLPKEVFGKNVRRSVVWRNVMLRANFPNNDGYATFTLTSPQIGTEVRRSPTFTGKVWDSKEAVQWCQENLKDYPLRLVGTSAPAIHRAAAEMAALSANPLFGSF